MFKLMGGTKSKKFLLAVSMVLISGAISMGIVRPMLPLYLISINLEPYLLGLVVSVSMIGMVIGESFSGLISDRFGMRVPLVLSTLVCGVALFAFMLSTALPFLFFIGFLWGILRGLMVGPIRGYMADTAPPPQRATYIAISSAILSLSRGVGALPGGIIVDKLGYNWVFYIAGVVAVLGVIATIYGPKHSLQIEGTRGHQNSANNWRTTIPFFFILCIIGMFGFLNVGILLTYVPLLGTQIMGISATTVGVIFTINGLATMAFSIPVGIMADKIGKRLSMVLGLAICAGAMLGIAGTGNIWWLISLGIVHALGIATFMTSALGVLSDYMPAGRLATAMGLYGGIGENSGLVLGSAIGGFVWEGFGSSATFITAAFACALGVLMCLVLVRIQGPAGRMKAKWYHSSRFD